MSFLDPALTAAVARRVTLEDDLHAAAQAAGFQTWQRRSLYRHFTDEQLEGLTRWLLAEAVADLI